MIAPPSPSSEFSADKLKVAVYPDRRAMGEAAASYVARHLLQLLANQGEARIVVGSAPSQDEFFGFLTSPENVERVDWSRIVVFHMDEYVGLNADHPQSFRAYQQKHLLSKVTPKIFHPISGEALDLEAECRRLTDLLTEKPIDLVCLGIGENGHLAFNDPPAPFDDPEWVKVVELDAACRRQQVNDGCFPSVADVPGHAITLTLRLFREAAKLSGVVPGPRKARAVVAALKGPITQDCPATLIRNHPDARLFLDVDSAALIAEDA
ncbi:MAG TPA: glucosamine-6-phosphate deaminase [Rhodothermales bacterium]